MRKRMLYIGLMILGLFVLVACSSEEPIEEPEEETEESEEEEEKEEKDEAKENEEEEELSSDAKKESKEQENGKSSGDQKEAGDEVTYMTKTGVFNGRADPHTVEIETESESGPVAFQLTLEARKLVESLDSGDAVKYTYYKDGEQLVIEDIHKVSEGHGDDQRKTKTEKGIYNGQADPHTIEIETKNGPTAFQLTLEARELVEPLNPGDDVTYEYYKDGEQLVIQFIEKNN